MTTLRALRMLVGLAACVFALVSLVALPPGHAQTDRVEAAWSSVTFPRAGFDEVVALALDHHVLPAIPERAWATAASGALRSLDPPLDLLPAVFLAEARTQTATAWFVTGDTVDLPACKGQFAIVALRRSSAAPAAADSSELRVRRQQRRELQQQVRLAWEHTKFGQAGFNCVLASAQALIAAQPDDGAVAAAGTPTPTAQEQRLQRESRLWRQASTHFLQGLDAHGGILPTALFTQFEHEAATQQAVDVGMVLGKEGDDVKVMRVERTGPAALAGMRKGWIVQRIDGKLLAGVLPQELNKMLEGKAGSKVELMAMPPDAKKAKKIMLVRSKLERSTVSGVQGGEGTGVALVRMGAFATGSAKGIREALADVALEIGAPPTGLVLDFRGNGGGWVKEATDVADLFLADGVIASQHGRNGHPKVFSASPSKDDLKLPVVMLVDGECKSSCELVTSALQDADRAVVIGQRTFGKGSVQAVIDATQGPWSVLITIATYRGPRGRSLQGLGVQPDIALPTPANQLQASVRESDLSTSLLPDEQVPPHHSKLATPAVMQCAASRAPESVPWRKKMAYADPWLLAALDAVACVGK